MSPLKEKENLFSFSLRHFIKQLANMAANLSNDEILLNLKHGIAHFEIASSLVPSVSTHFKWNSPHLFTSLNASTPRFFARIGSSPGKKSERYSVKRVTGDGRCMFRALVKGMALNKGVSLGPREEREGADELRLAIKEVICDNAKERIQFEEALIAITVDEPLRRPDFWGGEAELLVLSRLCSQPIVVYIPENERGGYGSGFVPIQEYGSEFRNGKPRKVVRLLYTGGNHYDLLV